MRAVLLVGLCACRLGFDELGNGDSGGPSVTITFGERPTSHRTGVTTDTWLAQTDAGFNYGGDEDLSIGVFGGANDEHAVLRFDLSSIAIGTQVTGARLQIRTVDFGDESPGPVDILLVAESWVEGTSRGSPSNAVSWATRDGTQPWSNAGGTTTQSLATLTPASAAVEVALDPAVVQSWVDNPTTNFGVLLAAATSNVHFHFHASEANATDRRPQLVLDVVQ